MSEGALVHKDVTAKTRGLQIVLNGGGSVMESATIPIQWFLSKSVAEMCPTHILIVDQMSHWKGDLGRAGRREIFPIDQSVCFLQIETPGKHRLFFIAIKVAKNHEYGVYNRLLATSNFGAYKVEIEIEYDNATGEPMAARMSNQAEWTISVDSTVAVVDVPKELFASRPTSGVKAAIWNFTNSMFNRPPVDQCAMRKRLLIAFPLKVLFYGTFRFVLGVFITVWNPLVSSFWLFIGWCPGSIWKKLRLFWNFNDPIRTEDIHEDPQFWDGVDLRGGAHVSGYRIWKVQKDENGRITRVKRMPFAPWVLVFPSVLIWSLVTGRTGTILIPALQLILWSALIVFAVTSVLLLISWKRGTDTWIGFSISKGWIGGVMTKRREAIRRRKEEEENRQRQLQKSIDAERVEWLKKSLVMEPPPKVDLSHLPEARRPIRRVFYVGFWQAKAKVCKPFPRY